MSSGIGLLLLNIRCCAVGIYGSTNFSGGLPALTSHYTGEATSDAAGREASNAGGDGGGIGEGLRGVEEGGTGRKGEGGEGAGV